VVLQVVVSSAGRGGPAIIYIDLVDRRASTRQPP
jgi:hypothetical protein